MNETQLAPLKLYSKNMIRWGTIFFGPLVGSFFVARNYKNTGKEKLAQKSIIIGVLTTVILLVYNYFVADDVIDSKPLFYAPCLYYLILSFFWLWYQDGLVEMHRANGGDFYSVWRAFGMFLLCTLILGASGGCVQFLKPPFHGEKMNFGKVKNSIYFPNDFDRNLVKQAGSAFEEIGFFNSKGPVRLRIRKKDKDYWITLLIMKKALADTEIVNGLNLIRTELQQRVFHETTRLEIFEVKFYRNFQQEIIGCPDDACLKSFHETERRKAFFLKLRSLSSDLHDILNPVIDTDINTEPKASVSQHSDKDVHLGIIVTENEKKAKEALNFITEAGSFEQAARKFSIAPNAVSGGDIGYVQPEHLNHNFSAALARLNGTDISDIIKSDNQFVILKVYK